MSELPRNPDFADLPEAAPEPKSRWSFQVVWLIPIVSALIGGYIAVKAVMDRGPTVSITFSTAEGLEAGKTKLKYKDVDIGLVKTVTLARDLKGVVASAELVKDFTPYLVEDTRFWIVRPRISGGSVSGLSTLLSGSYIGVDTGKSKDSARKFVGLETPPVVPVDTPGHEFVLQGEQMATVDSGSPVFFRRLRVGQVTSYRLNDDGKGVTLKVFVNEPYDKYVNANTRFWNASGIDMKLDANGVKIEMESVVSLIVGGIAFETPEGSALLPAGTNTAYTLFASRVDAMKNPESDVVKFVMTFNESARGLTVGAPIDFRGITLGEVSAIKADVDYKSGRVIIPVEANIYPDRLRRLTREAGKKVDPVVRKKFMEDLVANGLRAQLRQGSLITGQLYIAFDFFPKAPRANIQWTTAGLDFPTTPGARQELASALASVTSKLERFPLDELGRDARTALASADQLIKAVHTDVTPDLRQTLQSGTKLLQRLDAETAPELQTTLVDARKALVSADKLLSSEAPLQTDTREAMQEIARAAHAFRILADYIERNPQALLLGKREDAR